jgi:hypothetical protein
MQTEILETLELERRNGEYRWRDILKRDEVQTGRRVLLAYGMQFMNQIGRSVKAWSLRPVFADYRLSLVRWDQFGGLLRAQCSTI